MSTAAVSSAGTTLYATASKEWVIPAKPKPGRKPKKDALPAMEEVLESDSKGRRVQNRAAQRAFRERKQSQLAELQARVQQYEQGEVERNVALQNIAKRLKEENEKLRQENNLLKDKVQQLEDRLTAQDVPRKRTRGVSPSISSSMPSSHLSRKRSKTSSDSLSSMPPLTMSIPYAPSSPSSEGYSPRSDASSHMSYSPLPTIASPHEPSMGGSLGGMLDLAGNGDSPYFEGGPLSCGFCSASTSCVCKEITIKQVSEQLSLSDATNAPMATSPQLRNSSSHLGLQHLTPPPSNSQASILDNLPEYQAPVPLRRRSPVNTASIFPVAPPSEPRDTVATCSGDPSNCLACADDAFGKAFCDAIGKSVASKSQCGYCPDPSQAATGTESSGGCCGNPVSCGGCGSGATVSLADAAMSSEIASTSETMSCDNAWRQLKSHPNVAFADLRLLADVVARRSKCTGPRVEICPAPGTVTPERGLSPPINNTMPSLPQQVMDNQPVLLSDPRSDQTTSGAPVRSPPPQLVPQEILISCGRQRVREVMADGVRDALRLLDAKFLISGRANSYAV